MSNGSTVAAASSPHDTVPPRELSRPHRDPAPAGANAEQSWLDAKRVLAQRLSAAAFRAWVEPLQLASRCHPVGENGSAETAPANGAPIRLRCSSAFQCEQVTRRYKAAIEEALGAPVELVVGA